MNTQLTNTDIGELATDKNRKTKTLQYRVIEGKP